MPPTIVVIDDDDDLREALEMALTDEGWHVIAGPGANAVLDRARTSPPCAIVVDLHLHDEGAAETLRRVREAAGRRVPAILASGAQDLDRHAELIDADGAILKPFTVRQLIDRLRPYCR